MTEEKKKFVVEVYECHTSRMKVEATDEDAAIQEVARFDPETSTQLDSPYFNELEPPSEWKAWEWKHYPNADLLVSDEDIDDMTDFIVSQGKKDRLEDILQEELQRWATDLIRQGAFRIVWFLLRKNHWEPDKVMESLELKEAWEEHQE